ncbi:TonB-dependent siderophore receptor [Marinobacter sp. C2H3]|uniref:TonB-dependent siderophore receptor n=1 Tax=Marinobacter sp. C2H3 TaxID=3119003 RepID=UPI00300F5C85
MPLTTSQRRFATPCARAAVAASVLTACGTPLSALAQQTLAPLEVTGDRIDDPSAPVDGYVATRSRAGTKTNTPLTETPQAISVVTADQMDDQGVTSVQEALRYTAGVGAEQYGLDSRGDWQSVRGGDPAVYLDGLQKTFGYYQSPRTEPFLLERIEVVRGPSSVLYGQGNVGGIINLVSKRPRDTDSTRVELQAGNHNRHQAAIDSTGRLNDDGSLLYRLVAVGRDSDTQVNRVQDDRIVVAPSLTWRPTDATEWTLMALRQKDSTGTTAQFLPIEGTLKPSPHGLPRIPTDLFISEPDFDRYDTEEAAVTSLLSHRLNDVWTVRQNLRYSESDVDYRSIYPMFTPALKANGDIARVAYAKASELDSLALDNQAEALFSTGTIDHTLLLGWDYQHAVSDGRSAYAADIGDLNVFNPVYGQYTRLTDAAYSEVPENTVIQSGFYGQHQMIINERWITVLGLRQDRARNKTEGGTAFTDREVTGRVGLMYRFDHGITPFVSYSESFQPITGVNAYGDAWEPLKGEQVELGVKVQPDGSDSLYTATVYDLTEKNRRAPDPANPQNQIQNGETRARGLELEAKVAMTEQWDLIANYAYTDTEVVEGTNEGARLATIPEHTASVWSQHDLSALGAPGLRAGAGVRYLGASWDGSDQLRVPSETLLDAMLGYTRGPWDLALNVSNLTDETYYSACLARGDCFIGTRRTIIGSVGYRF